MDKLTRELKSSLNRKSDLIPRVIAFLKIILSEEQEFNREELKDKLFEMNIGKDIGQTGRYLSNISQFLTKKSNPHFRQIISFESGGTTGEVKNNYLLLSEYRELVNKILQEIEDEDSN